MRRSPTSRVIRAQVPAVCGRVGGCGARPAGSDRIDLRVVVVRRDKRRFRSSAEAGRALVLEQCLNRPDDGLGPGRRRADRLDRYGRMRCGDAVPALVVAMAGGVPTRIRHRHEELEGSVMLVFGHEAFLVRCPIWSRELRDSQHVPAVAWVAVPIGPPPGHPIARRQDDLGQLAVAVVAGLRDERDLAAVAEVEAGNVLRRKGVAPDAERPRCDVAERVVLSVTLPPLVSRHVVRSRPAVLRRRIARYSMSNVPVPLSCLTTRPSSS